MMEIISFTHHRTTDLGSFWNFPRPPFLQSQTCFVTIKAVIVEYNTFSPYPHIVPSSCAELDITFLMARAVASGCALGASDAA